MAAPLVSLAGLIECRVYDRAGSVVGRLNDVVVRWDAGTAHPPLHGVLVRARRELVFVPQTAIAAVRPGEVRLSTQGLELRTVQRQDGLVALAHEVLDRQIVDVDGTDVVRVSDLVLACEPDGVRLVGVDVSVRTLLRRLGTGSMRRRVAPRRLYDWASVAAFSQRGATEAASVLRLNDPAAALRARGPSELDSLLADLPPHERAELAEHLSGQR